MSWQGSRYSVPGQYAGQSVWVRASGRDVEVHYGGERIAVHGRDRRKHVVVTQLEHHRGIPWGVRQDPRF